jgi:CubicO group peptidase (beta-lactamase class C family)
MKRIHPAVRTIDGHVAAGAFAGAGLVVWQRGAIILEHYAGTAAAGLPAGPDVLWPIASISKVYTAAAIMGLVEDGLATLNTPVSLAIPEFKGVWRDDMRLRHLLTHTAGFVYESPDMEARLLAHTPLCTLVDEALASALLFRPGSALSYADNNYLVAGHIAEVITGEPLPALVRARVLDPAGLHQTFFPPSSAHDSSIATVRGVAAEGTDGAMYNSRYARALAHPAFGVVATTGDLARFGSTFMAGGPRCLSEAAVRTMTTDQTGGVPGFHPSMQGYATDLRVPWAAGFALQTERLPGLYSDLSSPRTFGHGGASGCVLVCDPAAGIVVALTTNTHLRTGREPWTRRIQSIVNCVFASISG